MIDADFPNPYYVTKAVSDERITGDDVTRIINKQHPYKNAGPIPLVWVCQDENYASMKGVMANNAYLVIAERITVMDRHGETITVKAFERGAQVALVGQDKRFPFTASAELYELHWPTDEYLEAASAHCDWLAAEIEELKALGEW